MDTKLIRWRDVVDTAAGRDEMIVSNWQRLAAAAWDGYLKAGRGAVMLNLRSTPNAGINPGVILESSYVALDSLNALAEESDSVPEVLRDQLDRIRYYDVRREFVLFIVSGDGVTDGGTVRCHRLHSDSEELLDPPEAYGAEQGLHREDSYLN